MEVVLRKWIMAVLGLVLMCSVTFAANDFSGDGNCVCLWSFESGALTTDSIGSNTLTNTNAATADTVNYKEGSASTDMEADSDQYYIITDGNLDAGFPISNGEGKTCSMCVWVKWESFSGSFRRVFAKYLSSNMYTDASGTLVVGWSGNVLSFGTDMTTGVWYHIGWTYDDSTGEQILRVWDDNAGALLDTNASQTSAKMTLNTNALRVGAFAGGGTTDFDGQMDEMVWFDDILSDAEIDQIRAGTYGAAAAAGGQVIIIGMD